MFSSKTDNSKNVSYFTTFRGQERNLLRIVFQFHIFHILKTCTEFISMLKLEFLTRIFGKSTHLHRHHAGRVISTNK